jgi:hypothetical protein
VGTLRPHGTDKDLTAGESGFSSARVTIIDSERSDFLRWHTNGSCSSFRKKVNVKGGGQEFPPQTGRVGRTQTGQALHGTSYSLRE